MSNNRRDPVLVTTEHRGVFFGYLNGRKPGKKQLTLERCRNCGFWSRPMGGFLGLATQGPDDECRVGPPATKTTIYDITSATEVSAKAVKKWETASW